VRSQGPGAGGGGVNSWGREAVRSTDTSLCVVLVSGDYHLLRGPVDSLKQLVRSRYSEFRNALHANRMSDQICQTELRRLSGKACIEQSFYLFALALCSDLLADNSVRLSEHPESRGTHSSSHGATTDRKTHYDTANRKLSPPPLPPCHPGRLASRALTVCCPHCPSLYAELDIPVSTKQTESADLAL